MPRLKGRFFETASIERYRRRESSVEEALIEMYMTGVSVRRVEDTQWCNKKYMNMRHLEAALDDAAIADRLHSAGVCKHFYALFLTVPNTNSMF